MVEALLVILLVIASLAIILKAANYLIDGAVAVARWKKVSPLMVGLTIVAMGTSLPELVVSLFAAFAGRPDLSVGNIIGSNIANIALVLGLSMFISPLIIRSKTLLYEVPFLTVSSFLLLLLANDQFIQGRSTFTIQWYDALIFLMMMGIYVAYIYRSVKREQKSARKAAKKEFQEAFPKKDHLWKNVLAIIGGFLGLFVGGQLFVWAAGQLAVMFGIQEALVGLLIAAVGTSMPELASSIVAAWKRQGDIAVGNIVGSNIFNIVFILGVVPLFRPLSVTPTIILRDGMIMIFVSLLFLFFATRDRTLSRKEGIALLGIYGLYLVYLFWAYA